MSLGYDMVANYLHNKTTICQADSHLHGVDEFHYLKLIVYQYTIWYYKFVIPSYVCLGRTGRYLQMNQLSMRNNRLKFKTSGGLLIILEESIEEYASNE